MNLYLVGSMGAGKTTIGRGLSRRLHRPFFDSDHEIVARCGVDIPTIFEFEGESGFRERECSVIDSLCGEKNIVMATGGGAIINPDNRARMKSSGLTIYLVVSIDEQLRRTRRDRSRPLLNTENPRKQLEMLAEARRPLYDDVADIRITTDGQSATRVIGQLLTLLRRDYKI